MEKTIDTNPPFYSPKLDRGAIETSLDARDQVVNLLRSPKLQAMIADGRVTIGMLKPSLGPEANIEGLDDLVAAEKIEEQIEDLGVAAKFAFIFNPETIDEFYEVPNKYTMLAGESSSPDVYPNKWEQYKAMMGSGPVTVLLLQGEEDAVGILRAQLGHWDVETRRDPSTIRGKFGANNDNNLIHGSDSPESVSREAWIIANCMETKPSNYGEQEVERQRGDLSRGEWLHHTGALPSPDEPHGIKTNGPWRRSTETYVLDFEIVHRTNTVRAIAKACIKIPPAEVMTDWVERREILSETGVDTPKLWGVTGATLVEEHIPYSLEEAKAIADNKTRQHLQDEFERTRQKIIDSGFHAISLHDLRSRGDDVVVIDVGEDLGASTRRQD